MKRFNVKLETEYGMGYYDGEVYTNLVVTESKTGQYTLSKDTDKLLSKIKRMQRRIDQLQGRI